MAEIKVNTDDLKQHLNNLNKYISNYESKCKEISKELGKVSSYWMGQRATVFMGGVDEDKKSTQKVVDSLKGVKKAYQKVYDSFNNFK